IVPYLDAANVDLKSFREEYYRKICGASLKPVLDTLILMKERKLWVEVTTLVLPGQNDSDAELQDIALFIRDNLGSETPWHISRFFPRYQMDASPPTPPETIDRARQIGLDAGLQFVYSGNLTGGSGESTFCPNCGKTVIGRFGFALTENKIQGGCCSFCGTKVAGVFR
ncbi:MAG: radical SAM protein, partial [Atribacterota bacterium]|nr:radical SAM protein [Atribacterota bacterium]